MSNEVAELFAEFDEDILADVLRLWDCDAQDWFDGTTMVLRFESDDLLVWNELGRLGACKGAVDTSTFDKGAIPALQLTEDKEICLTWRPDSAYAMLLGESALTQTLLEMFT